MSDKSILLVQKQDGRLLINPAHCPHIKTDFAVLPESFSEDGTIQVRRVDFCLDCRLVLTPEYKLFHKPILQQVAEIPSSGAIPVVSGSESG